MVMPYAHQEWVSMGRVDVHIQTIELPDNEEILDYLIGGYQILHKSNGNVILGRLAADTIYGVQ